MEVLDRYGIRGTVALNSDLCDRHPTIIEEGKKRQWEWMGHNESNTRRLNEAPPGEEAQIIKRTFETIARATGVAAQGLARAPACRRPGIRSTCWRRRAASMSATGATTTSPT